MIIFEYLKHIFDMGNGTPLDTIVMFLLIIVGFVSMFLVVMLFPVAFLFLVGISAAAAIAVSFRNFIKGRNQ